MIMTTTTMKRLLRRSDNDERMTIGLLQYEDDCGDDDAIVALK